MFGKDDQVLDIDNAIYRTIRFLIKDLMELPAYSSAPNV